MSDGRIPKGPARGKTRLFLVIDDKQYLVRREAIDPESGAERCYRLRNAEGNVYHVARVHYPETASHVNECDCPDFVFRRSDHSNGPCKHIGALVAHGLLDPDDADWEADPTDWPAWTNSERFGISA